MTAVLLATRYVSNIFIGVASLVFEIRALIGRVILLAFT